MTRNAAPQSDRHQGKVAIVTGAAQGIGRACALRLAADGAFVVAADIKNEGIDVVRDIRSNGGHAEFVKCDVSEQKDVENLIKIARVQPGSLHIVVNNAGISHKSELLELEEADFDRVLRVNVKGAFFLSQLAARIMVEEQTPGVIVNISSINGQVALSSQIAYCTSKGALNQLTKSMALSLASRGIRVNAVAPGSIDTPMLAGVFEDRTALHNALSRTPVGRIGLASEVAATVSFLASEDASYITGEIINIDGGRLALNNVVPVNLS